MGGTDSVFPSSCNINLHRISGCASPKAEHTKKRRRLVQPRKTRPFITERLLMGSKEPIQTKQSNSLFIHTATLYI